jgi:two-component system, OmpR family, response regulator
VRALLRRSARSAPSLVAAGDLRVDPARHRCWRGGIEVTLTAREFAVLEYLVRRAGEVVAKRELLEGVWDYDFDGDPNIVEVYVRHLRRKIDEPFGRRAIETIRGAGYRLAADGG